VDIPSFLFVADTFDPERVTDRVVHRAQLGSGLTPAPQRPGQLVFLRGGPFVKRDQYNVERRAIPWNGLSATPAKLRASAPKNACLAYEPSDCARAQTEECRCEMSR